MTPEQQEAERRPFHQRVDSLCERVVEMAALSRQSVEDGVAAFRDLDVEKARAVMEFNQKINRMDVEIEAAALNLLALQAPMAKDLRRVGAALKMITYLDRIGRYGYDVAEATLALEGKQHVRKLVSIPFMSEKALGLLDTAVDAFKDRDAERARTVQPADDDVDALYEQIFRECVTYMLEEPRNISLCTQYILVARHLERVGDNAGKIAEKVIYMVTGERRLPPTDATGTA